MPSVVTYRRDLHRIPEEEDRLPKTCRYVRSVLEPLNCVVTTPTQSSVCAYFDAGKPETVAFRADMDALPVEEQTGLPFTSEHPRFMHACGHDGHTAMLLALAEYLSEHLDGIPRNALLIFQPAEERPGGARPLCETGLLEQYRVSRIFGLHLWPKLPFGRVCSRPGPMMAQANEVDVTITGKSVHISRYQEGLDALDAGQAFLCRAYALAESLPSWAPSVLRFGKMVSGTARNAVSSGTRMEGTLRTYHEETFRFFRDGLEEIRRAVWEESGCEVAVHLSDGYPAVWNHEELYRSLCDSLGRDAPLFLETPVLAAEDFSFYQRRVPGVFFFLGAGQTPELHAQNFDFDDESILPVGVEFLKKLLMLP